MTIREFCNKAQEIAQNKTPNNYSFGILQLNNLIESALQDGISQNLINEVMKMALNDLVKVR